MPKAAKTLSPMMKAVVTVPLAALTLVSGYYLRYLDSGDPAMIKWKIPVVVGVVAGGWLLAEVWGSPAWRSGLGGRNRFMMYVGSFLLLLFAGSWMAAKGPLYVYAVAVAIAVVEGAMATWVSGYRRRMLEGTDEL